MYMVTFCLINCALLLSSWSYFRRNMQLWSYRKETQYQTSIRISMTHPQKQHCMSPHLQAWNESNGGFHTFIPQTNIAKLEEHISVGQLDMVRHLGCVFYRIKFALKTLPLSFVSVSSIIHQIMDRFTRIVIIIFKGNEFCVWVCVCVCGEMCKHKTYIEMSTYYYCN